MKRILLLSVAILTVMVQHASAQELELPQPSPWAQVSQKFGLAQATITYSRPSMKGRKIFGTLVPFGEMWRTGANKAVELKLEGKTTINGVNIEPGAYSLFTIPGQNEWTIVINKNTELWGTGGYKQEDDVTRLTVKTNACPPTETFTIDFSNVTDKSVTVQIYWETTKVSFDITTDYLEQGKQNIEAAIKAAENTAGLYNDAAEFYLDNNLDAKLALEWAQKSVAQRERYWTLFTLARALAANNKIDEAITAGEKALTLSNEAKNTGFSQSIEKELNAWKARK